MTTIGAIARPSVVSWPDAAHRGAPSAMSGLSGFYVERGPARAASSPTPPAALCPAYFPVTVSTAAAPEPLPRQQRPQLSRTRWPQIAERARYASLRDLAVEYGVSHETIRAIVRRVAAHRRGGLIA